MDKVDGQGILDDQAHLVCDIVELRVVSIKMVVAICFSKVMGIHMLMSWHMIWGAT